jgi:Ca2+:H+ antiporter
MEFIVALLRRLHTDRSVTLSEAASETYYSTLQQYHGWIVTGTFTVALKLVPSRGAFLEKAGAGGAGEEEVQAEMAAFCEAFGAVLAEVHLFLESNGLNDPAKV